MSGISKRSLGAILLGATAAWFALVSPTSAGTTWIYAGGHCDLCADYEDGGLSLHYHFHATGPGYAENGKPLVGEYDPAVLYTRVPDITKTTVPTGSDYGFLGAPAGSDAWILSQNPVAGVPYLGFGTEELDPDDWSSTITYRLVGADGPGEVSMWMSNPFGSPAVYWATSDGVSDSDVYSQAALGHSHANWGFTAEGVYRVQMQVSGVLADGKTTVSSNVETFTFLVGNNTVVPEPGTSTLLALGLGTIGLMVWKRRSCRRA